MTSYVVTQPTLTQIMSTAVRSVNYPNSTTRRGLELYLASVSQSSALLLDTKYFRDSLRNDDHEDSPDHERGVMCGRSLPRPYSADTLEGMNDIICFQAGFIALLTIACYVWIMLTVSYQKA